MFRSLFLLCAVVQAQTNPPADVVPGAQQVFQIVNRLQLALGDRAVTRIYLHFDRDDRSGFYYYDLCTNSQSRAVSIRRLFKDSIGHVRLGYAQEDFLAYGYFANSAVCAEFRRQLEIVNSGELTSVEFNQISNAQRSLLWLDPRSAEQQIKINGRLYTVYRSSALNPLSN